MTTILSAYQTEQVPWHAVKRDAQGEPIRNIDGEVEYETQTVAAQVEERTEMVLNTRAEEVVSQARVLTEAPIEPGDLVTLKGRDWPVINVSRLTWLTGQFSHREVSV